MKVELLYFDGCPSWQEGLMNLRAALDAEGLTAEIVLIEVKDNDQANRMKFLGSPSFQVNGQDLWSELRQNYALSCRMYTTPAGLRGAPTAEMLRLRLTALREYH